MLGRPWTAGSFAALISLTLGCGRLGYASHRLDETDGGTTRDAPSIDARTLDAALPDGAPRLDAGPPRDAGRDAGRPVDSGSDGGGTAADAALDAGLPEPVCTPGLNRVCGMGGFQTCSPAGTWCDCNGDSATGSPGGWSGCRGNGLAVCTELVAGFPCYWENHPRCASNPTCGGVYFSCNRDCPAPSAADACTCAGGGAGWLGCGGGCTVCDDVLVAYPCYFLHHWACEPAACGDARELCDARCPPPVDADRGSTSPAP